MSVGHTGGADHRATVVSAVSQNDERTPHVA